MRVRRFRFPGVGLLLCLLGLFMPAYVGAVAVQGLYEGSAQVADQEADSRKKAFNQAFAQVVVKVSGTSSVLANDAVARQLSQAESYVQRFSYRTQASATPDTDDQPPASYIDVEFSPVAVNELLRRAGAPIWGQNRPALMLWMGLVQQGERTVLAATAEDGPLLAWISSQAGQRGLPVYLPSMDLQDQSVISVSDIWGLFLDPFIKASARYGADVVAIARVSESGAYASVQWMLELRGSRMQGVEEASSREAAIAKLIHRLADVVANRYAVIQSDQSSGQVELEVTDILNFRSYVGVSRYLTSLAPVRSVVPLYVRDNRVGFRLMMEGSVDLLQEYVALDAWLKPESQLSAGTAATGRIRYRWVGGDRYPLAQ